MKQALSILKQHWGYDNFRPLQEDIVDAVLAGNDVLALMPTGGGKSICFQIPAMALEGVCIVVTPLIALMKDQVEQLRARGIKAEAIYSGLSSREIDIKLDNCVYGNIKFLYVSPERLKTDIFIERAKKMQICLLAIDEAHCISQWGYDFRPPYLELAEFRNIIPEINVIALTATATTVVRDDIQEKLQFKDGKVFQQSFARSNLSYSVRKEEDKDRKLIEVLKKVPGSAIVYTRTRKGTKDLAKLLHQNQISCDFYHAGLSHQERSEKQDKWIKNRIRVIVATNAFGMGIDKPDVRLVVHMDLPEDLESYYQEAGRAGRDQKKAFAVIIYNDLDIELLKDRQQQKYPDLNFLKQVYQALANYYKLAVGSGLGQSFDIDIHEFSENYKMHYLEVFYALKKLEGEGLLQFNESFHKPSQLYISIDNKELYKFQIANSVYDPFIKGLLRVYGGELFNGFVKISEKQVASFLNISESEFQKVLIKLNELGVVLYEPKKDKPQVVFTAPRENAQNLTIDKVRLKQREKTAKSKLEAMVNYVQHEHRCRTQLLLEYFGEVSYDQCGVCDICVQSRKKQNVEHMDDYHHVVRHVLEGGSLTVEEIVDHVNPPDKEVLLEVIREMVDAGEVRYDDQWRLGII